MGGTLVHSKTFRINRWSSEENGPHYEVTPDEGGDYDFMSYTSWFELKQYCASFGMAPEDWPDFTDYDNCIDVPLDELDAKQAPFRQAIERLPPDAIAGNHRLARIVVYLRNDEQVCFC